LRPHRKLAYGKVRLLLTGAPLTEGYAPDFHHRLMGAWVLRLASHLTRAQLRRRSNQEDLLPSAWSNIPSCFSSLSCLSSQIHHRKRWRRNRLITPSPFPLNPAWSLLILQIDCNTLLVTSFTSFGVYGRLRKRGWLSPNVHVHGTPATTLIPPNALLRQGRSTRS
jgi:hypothetical protein